MIEIGIKVCDAPMGSGKTESAVTLMNMDKDSLYIFLTPYLNEVERIKASCRDRNFISPENKGQGKLSSFHYWLGQQRNIASTHALFSTCTGHTSELIRAGKYKLILDEVFDVMQPIQIKKDDLAILFKSGLAKVSDDKEHIVWLDDQYDGTKYQDIMKKAKSNSLVYYKESLLFWSFPASLFEAFQEVIILTYLFRSQFQKYYYDINNVSVSYLGTHFVNGRYEFCSELPPFASIQSVKDKIHILQDRKMNQVGDYEYALSSSWFAKEKNKKGRPSLQRLRKNLNNLYKNKYKSTSSQNMWTTFKDAKGVLSGKGYMSGFVPCNMRATNEYRDKTHLAYCVNIFFNPMFKNYFAEHGAAVDEDGYALSEMIQWIWRSAIRDGKDIWVYIPSSRMRNILLDWLNSG